MLQRSRVPHVPQDDTPSSAGLLRGALIEARDAFPVWFGAWLAIGHLLTAIVTLPSHSILNVSLSLLLPVTWLVAFYVSRRRLGQWPTAGVLAALSLSAPLIAVVLWLPAALAHDPLDMTRIKFAFEILAPCWVACLMWHCHRTRGWRGVALFFGVGAVYGFFLENGGIVLGYFSEPDYRIYVPFSNTPLSSVAGWCTIFYPSVFIAESLTTNWAATRRTALTFALLVAVIALSTDLHFDPIATGLRMWVWHESLPPVWSGVPLVNFTSWLTSVFAFAIAYGLGRERGWIERALPAFAVIAIPVMLTAAGLANLLLIGLLEGFNGPSWTIFRVAMSKLSF